MDSDSFHESDSSINSDVEECQGLDDFDLSMEDLLQNVSQPIQNQIRNQYSGEAILIEEMSDVEAPAVHVPPVVPARRRVRAIELTDDQRRVVYETLLKHSVHGVVRGYACTNLARQYGVDPRTIQKLWKRTKENGGDWRKMRKGNCGRRPQEFDMEQIKFILVLRRQTFRSLSHMTGKSASYLHGKKKEGKLKCHSNAGKPILTPANIEQRIRHCVGQIDPRSLPDDPQFNAMRNVIHIDEKWFYLTKNMKNYYMWPGEADPVRPMRSANYIPKVMFLAAVARPRFDTNGVCTFDGKIGIFPFVDMVAAKRKSVNRPRGTLELKPKTSVTRAVIRQTMLDELVPAIMAKWPIEDYGSEIIIQQDNAKTHILVDDDEFFEALEATGLNLKVYNQPPNFPDLNVLDLGFFRAIGSLQMEECTNDVGKLVQAIESAYEAFSVKSSNHIFLTLQSCMIETLKIRGSNAYQLPHLGKKKLERQGRLPLVLKCPKELLPSST